MGLDREPNTLTAAIKAQALALGFDKVGVIPAEPLQPEGDRLAQWLTKGSHGDMAWMADKAAMRSDPKALMPEARSVLCVAMNYYHPAPVTSPKISRYARGEDYHRVLKRKLKALGRWISEEIPGTLTRAVTDSAPLMEKPLAVRAGIGWQGKHTNVITRDMGSWIFLGELLLSLDLIYEETRVFDACGTCTRCIDACPTQAITEPYVLDATRCISYWTIESKAETIPADISQHMNGWAFGCDICQEVCPWNVKFAQETTEEALLPKPWNLHPTPDTFEAMDEETFLERYRHTPLKRTGLQRLRRNMAMIAQK